MIYDRGEDTVSWEADAPVVLTDLNPVTTTLQLRIENNLVDGKVYFLYDTDGATPLPLGQYAIGEEVFHSLPVRFPVIYLIQGDGGDGSPSAGVNRELVSTGHPPVGFTFATNEIADMAGDFVITGYEGSVPPYSAYGFLGEGVGVQTLGFGPIDETTVIPTTGYETPPFLLLTEGDAYAFSLPGGAYGLLYARSVTPTPALGVYAVTMVFDFYYQPGTTPPSPDVSILGSWGVALLQHEPGNPPVWYAEQSRATFNLDGTGILAGVRNDGGEAEGDRIENFMYPFTYTLTPNADGSFALAMTIGDEQVLKRVVLSDDGSMAFMDGTADPEALMLAVLIRIGEETYDSFLKGNYYYQGFQYNEDDLSFGRYMALSGIHEFLDTLVEGNYRTHDWGAWNNSVKIDGTNEIWYDPGEQNQIYNVSPTGEVTLGGDFFRGALTANGKVFAGTGSYDSNDWGSYLFMKQGDRLYSAADLDGKWAVAGFGQENEPSEDMFFMAEIGTMTCDTVGTCQFTFRERASDGFVGVESGQITLDVADDGSIGGWLVDGLPSAANQPSTLIGAMGNDGNTLMLNASFDSADRREVFIAIRAEAIGDLAGSPDVDGLSFSGSFVDLSGQGVEGNQVMAWKWPVSDGVDPTISQTQTGSGGAFRLDDIPREQEFFLMGMGLTRGGGDGAAVPVLSRIMAFNENAQALLPYIHFFYDEYEDLGADVGGSGVIRGRVVLRENPTQGLAGATVSAQRIGADGAPVGDPVPAIYPDGAGATGATGLYMVKLGPAQVMETERMFALYRLTVSHDDYGFAWNSSRVPVQLDSMTQASFFAVEAGDFVPDVIYMRYSGGYELEFQLEGDMNNVDSVAVSGPAGSGIVDFPLDKEAGESWNVYPTTGFIPAGDFPGNFTGVYRFTATYSDSNTEDFTFTFQPGTPMELPSGIAVNEGTGMLSWDPVTGATGYYLIIFSGDYGQNYVELYHGEDDSPIQGTSVNLFALMADRQADPGDYKVRVVAVDGLDSLGNEAYSDPMAFHYTPAGPVPDLAQAITVLKVLVGLQVDNEDRDVIRDVNGDGKIGFAELLYILQTNAGLRRALP